MSTTSQLEVKKLKLDLHNFRTIPQKNEIDAIKAMISIKAERFYAIIESILADGYLPTENIIVLKQGRDYIVKEGNRRIAALKLIHGIYDLEEFDLTSSIINGIKKIDVQWKKANRTVPCTIFDETEADLADKVVTLAHGKGSKASRDDWNAVAHARHNRDAQGKTESGLDLLEKYLKKGRNLTGQQKFRWSGDYPLTVLHEALRKIYAPLGFSTLAALVTKYPKVNNLNELETIILEIGLERIKFATIRTTQFPNNFGIPPLVAPPSTPSLGQPPSSTGTGAGTPSTSTANPPSTSSSSTPTSSSSGPPSPGTGSGPNAGSGTSAPPAYAINDPKQVIAVLRKFTPRGNNRQKIVTLRDEIKKLKIQDNPIAFCFLLRSMFEISAKVFAGEHNIAVNKGNGKEKTLLELLRGITSHLTNNNANTAQLKVLHGSLTELAKSDGILSVTSMNQLVHNPTFSVAPADICTLFGNIYPLLEAMN